MTDEKLTPATGSDDAPEKVEYFVDVRDQRIQIGEPAPEQLAMMRITANRLARLNENSVSGDDAIRAFEKAIQVVTSLPINRSDRDWLEDLLLTREMDLEEANGIMEAAAEEWVAKGGNRSERRKAKATRKTAAKKTTATRK